MCASSRCTNFDFTPIFAAAGGVVISAELHPVYGNAVTIDHGNDLVTRYAHLSKLFVKEGAYPPPPEESGPKGIVGVINSFGKQCFSGRFYWYFYLMQTFWVASGA